MVFMTFLRYVQLPLFLLHQAGNGDGQDKDPAGDEDLGSQG